MKTKVILALIVILILIQFIQIETVNPTINAADDLLQSSILTDSDKLLLRNACMDCHSNETKFPSYSKIQPLGWLIRSHIRGGRQNLNFSEWNSYSAKKRNHKLEECKEVIEQNRMPMKSYTWMHPTAKLSDDQKEDLIVMFGRIQ